MSDHDIDQYSQNGDIDTGRIQKQRRKRLPLSCVECRRRKLKCNRLLPCKNCVRIGKADQCIYTGPQPPKATPEPISRRSAPPLRQKLTTTSEDAESDSYQMFVFDSKADLRYGTFRDSSDRGPHTRYGEAAWKESALHTPKSLGSDITPAIPVTTENACVDDRVRKLPDCSFRGRNGKTRYFGRSNHSTTLSYFQGLRPFVAGGHMRIRDKESRPFTLHNMVPQRDVADQLVRFYLNTFEPTYRTLNVPTFLESYCEFWKNPKSPNMDQEFVTQLVGVMAAGSSFYTASMDYQEREDFQKRAISWIIEAQAHITCNFVNPDLDFRRIQTQCILLIARLGVAGDDDESHDWVSSGLLIRSAMSIGLHRDPSRFYQENQKYPFPELRRRLWFTIVELDLMISIHRGFCPSIDLNECDCEPPAPIPNDLDMPEEPAKFPGSLSGISMSNPLYQTLLNRSLQLRLAIAKKVNTLNFDLSYDDVMRMSEEMIQMMHSSFSIFENILPQKDSSAVDSDEFAQHQFAQSLYLFTMRKFLLALHRPFSTSTAQLPKYSYSRKITLELSLDILSQRGVSSQNKIIHPHITQLGNSMFHKEVYHSAVSVCVELSIQSREKASAPLMERNGSGFLMSMMQSQQSVMIQAIEQTLDDFGQRIGTGGKGCKFYFFLALIICFVKTELEGKDPLARVEVAARKASQVCRAIINGQRYSDVIASYNTDKEDTEGVFVDSDPRTSSGLLENSEANSLESTDLMDLTSLDLIDWFGGLEPSLEMLDPNLFDAPPPV